MTTAEFQKSLEKKIADILKYDKPLMLGVKSIMAVQSNRIWLQAKNKNGAAIGTYSSNPIYINPKNSPKKFSTKGKYGETKFADGRSHVTGYFSNYLDYKHTIGRNKNSNTVDLILFGELNRNWANGRITNPSAKKVNQHNYVVTLSDTNIKKVERYGVNEVFGLSNIENKLFLKVVSAELAKALK